MSNEYASQKQLMIGGVIIAATAAMITKRELSRNKIRFAVVASCIGIGTWAAATALVSGVFIMITSNIEGNS